MNTKMKTHIFNGNQFTWFRHFRNQVVKMTKRVMIVLGVFSLIGWSMYVGSNFMPVTVFAEKEVVKEVQNYDIPVLNRIMQCESGSSHYDKNGQVLVRGNTGSRESVDVGALQINVKIWGATAKKMGYDLMKEQDNIAFGRWLFTNYGSEPWFLTKGCWNK